MTAFHRLFSTRAAMPRRRARSDGQWDRQIHHGTLRSELDEPAALLPEFDRLTRQFDDLRSRYNSGALTRAEMAEVLSEAKVTHADGSVWTIGATTGQWYRRFPGSANWEPALPPESGVDPAPATDSDVDAVPDWMTGASPLPAPAPLPAAGDVADPQAPWPEVDVIGSREPLPAPAAPQASSTWEAAARSASGSGADMWAILSEEPAARSYADDDEDVELPPELFDE